MFVHLLSFACLRKHIQATNYISTTTCGHLRRPVNIGQDPCEREREGRTHGRLFNFRVNGARNAISQL